MTVQTAFRLPKELFDKLKAIASEEGRTQTWYVVKALNQYFDGDTKKKPKSSSNVANEGADRVIDYLNTVSNRNYSNAESNRRLIRARLKDYSEAQLCLVIDRKWSEWRGTEVEKYFRPSTLFNATKFESYVNEKVTRNGSRSGSKQAQSFAEKQRGQAKKLMAEYSQSSGCETGGSVIHEDGRLI